MTIRLKFWSAFNTAMVLVGLGNACVTGRWWLPLASCIGLAVSLAFDALDRRQDRLEALEDRL